MSVVVKLPTGEIFLFCKGADNVILERAKEGNFFFFFSFFYIYIYIQNKITILYLN